MTEQEIFTAAYNHATSMKQMARRAEYTTCFYRAPNGEKCLIGSFIPDTAYDEHMEGMLDRLFYHYHDIFEPMGLMVYSKAPGLDIDWRELGRQGRQENELQRCLDDNRFQFLEGLQRCHDQSKTKQEMIDALLEFAKAHNFKVPA